MLLRDRALAEPGGAVGEDRGVAFGRAFTPHLAGADPAGAAPALALSLGVVGAAGNPAGPVALDRSHDAGELGPHRADLRVGG